MLLRAICLREDEFVFVEEYSWMTMLSGFPFVGNNAPFMVILILPAESLVHVNDPTNRRGCCSCWNNLWFRFFSVITVLTSHLIALCID